MSITYKQALEKTKSMIDNPNLFKHCLAVAQAMYYYAKNIYNLPEEQALKWKIAGILHDADWEKHPDKHPQIIVEWLKQNNVDSDIINAVASHGPEFTEQPKTLMAKAIRAIDEVTGFIIAVALVRGKKLSDLTIKSIKKKWKDKSFARGVNRQFIEQATKELNIPLEEHFQNVLNAMIEIKEELGLA